MGIQINGQTDTITAIDGALNVSGADLGSASAGSLNVTGIVTASGFSGNVTGNINSSGVSTFTNGPVFIGTGTSTGTASQPLQVTGGAYVSGNLGVGRTDSQSKIHIRGSGTSGQVTASAIIENLSSGTLGIDITGSAGSSRARFLYGGGPGTGTNSLTEGISYILEGANAGNLGIGTASPRAKLDVQGGKLLVVQSGTPTGTYNFGVNTHVASGSGGMQVTSGSNYSYFIGNSTDIILGSDQGSTGIKVQVSRSCGDNSLVIDGSGRVLRPYTPHIFGSVTNTSTVSNSYANSFTVVSSTELTFVTDRITVPVAGVYLITFCSISNNDSSRKDIYIYVNGIIRSSGLSEDSTAGFHHRGISMTIKLAANDYIQFYNQNWYSNTNTSFDQWRTASVTFLG